MTNQITTITGLFYTYHWIHFISGNALFIL